MSKSPAEMIPLGAHRTWSEEFVESCAGRIQSTLAWRRIGVVDKVNIEVNAPPVCGIYAFVRKSKLEGLTPFARYPLIVYVGLAKNLRKRLLQYVADKRVALRYTEGTSRLRSGVRSMFRAYKDALEIYYFECGELDLIATEDLLIKMLDPIFNESQKVSSEIKEADGYLEGQLGMPELAYGYASASDNTNTVLHGVLGTPHQAF